MWIANWKNFRNCSSIDFLVLVFSKGSGKFLITRWLCQFSCFCVIFHVDFVSNSFHFLLSYGEGGGLVIRFDASTIFCSLLLVVFRISIPFRCNR